jgi:hypothetical protein
VPFNHLLMTTVGWLRIHPQAVDAGISVMQNYGLTRRSFFSEKKKVAKYFTKSGRKISQGAQILLELTRQSRHPWLITQQGKIAYQR